MPAVDGTGALIDAVAWDGLFVQLYRSPAYQVAIGSGALLGIGLLGRYLRALTDVHRGVRPDFLAPLFRLVVFAVVMSHYEQICTGLLRFVADLGHGMLGDVSVEALWEGRRAALAALHGQDEAAQLAVASRDAWVTTYLTLGAHVGLCLSQAAILAVRTLQVFLLVVAFLCGPWLLALAFLGGPCTGFGWGWLLGTLEVASWSWGLKMLAFCMRKVLGALPLEPLNMSKELTLSLATVACVLWVPVAMGRLFRRQHWVAVLSQGVLAWPNPAPLPAAAVPQVQPSLANVSGPVSGRPRSF